MASTWRSNQSLAAWLVAQTNGPASATPSKARPHLPSIATPEATTPQANAHMGGNQVMGLKSSAMAASEGRDMEFIVMLTSKCVN